MFSIDTLDRLLGRVLRPDPPLGYAHKGEPVNWL